MSEEAEIVLQPMVHVRDMSSSIALFEVLGGTVAQGSRDGDWVQMRVGGAEVGLLGHPANPAQGEGDVELNFEIHGRLETVEAAAKAAGVDIASAVTDTGFGRQLQLRTNDGLLVKINEIDNHSEAIAGDGDAVR